jgi:hypothetical protein
MGAFITFGPEQIVVVIALSLIGRPRGEGIIMLRASIMFGVLAAAVCEPLPAGEKGKDSKGERSVRALKFAPKSPILVFAIGGKGKLTRCDDAVALANLLGANGQAEANALAAQVDFKKEAIVFISWTTSGPPDGVLTHQVTDKKVTFFVQGPGAGAARGLRARIGADFFAVPRDRKVTFDPKER